MRNHTLIQHRCKELLLASTVYVDVRSRGRVLGQSEGNQRVD